MFKFLAVWICICLLVGRVYAGEPAPSEADNGLESQSVISAEQQLMAMVAALEQQSYRGTLTYEFGGPLETLAFERLVNEHETQERIRHLSGRPRDFSRSLPDDYCGNAAMRLFVSGGGTPLGLLSQYYQFNLVGQNRVADRPVNIVKITPKDDDRYGFLVGLDRETHLPLMLTVTGARSQVLERFQFVELTLGPVLQVTDVTEESQRLMFTQKSCASPVEWDGWQPKWLPVGFVPASNTALNKKAVMSYTDGLASVSIFVTPIDQVSGAVGVVQRGATVAAMTMVASNLQSFKVAVVGEIPPSVAKRIAESVAFSPAPQ